MRPVVGLIASALHPPIMLLHMYSLSFHGHNPHVGDGTSSVASERHAVVA
jgi:hypothetical protein